MRMLVMIVAQINVVVHFDIDFALTTPVHVLPDSACDLASRHDSGTAFHAANAVTHESRERSSRDGDLDEVERMKNETTVVR